MAELNVAPGYRQQEVLQPGRYTLRHIAPAQGEEGGAGVISPEGQPFAVLGQTLYANPLPVSRLPDSPDFHTGGYTLRMYESGDFTVTFPNRDASDGQPWRSRFSAVGHKEFIEISRESVVETIGVIMKVVKDRQKITVSGYDGLFLLRKAYEQDWTGVIAPRDLIERYSEPAVGWQNATGTASFIGTLGTVTEAELEAKSWFLGPHSSISSEGVKVDLAGAGVSVGYAQGDPFIAGQRVKSSRWSFRTQIVLPAPLIANQGLIVELIWDAGTPIAQVEITPTQAAFQTPGFGGGGAFIPLPSGLPAGSHSIDWEADGRWMRAYLDGQLIGFAALPEGEHAITRFLVKAYQNSEQNMKATVTFGAGRSQQPFLMRGTEKGDYVLPGGPASYPVGGLHGRYIVNGATTSGEAWWGNILAPDPRRQGFPEFLQDQQPVIATPVPAGLPNGYYAARWFGAIYLPMSKGNIYFQLNYSDGVRVWIGNTQFGQQIIDDWKPNKAFGTALGYNPSEHGFPWGEKDGWYPIIIEHFFATGEGEGNVCTLYFEPSVTYTDPGGTLCKALEVKVIPATSLSPLGCVDARIQGSSFFDIVQEAAKNFGFQVRAEARQLESGEFPCQIIPKARVGIETDEVIETDDRDQHSGMNNWSVTEDATDSVASLKAFGSGIADGKGSQIAFEAISGSEEINDLFDLQGWVSATDIAFPALLAARAEAERQLRAGVWQNIEGEPIARDRLADTLPLTGVLNQFRWQPGDGVRLWLPEASLRDTTNRQILQVVRGFTAEGRSSSSIGFRARPKDPTVALRGALREATRSARSYQHQYVTRATPIMQSVLKAGEVGGFQVLPLAPGETVVDARIIIALNSLNMPVSLELNSLVLATVTAALGGPWKSPTVIDIFPYTAPVGPGTNNRIYAAFKNGGASTTELDWQMVLTLLV